MIGIAKQVANVNRSQNWMSYYLLGPILRAVIGVVLFGSADWLAQLIYPSAELKAEPQAETAGPE